MFICGIDLKGTEAIFALIEVEGDHLPLFKDQPTRKIMLGPDEDSQAIKDFMHQVASLMISHHVAHIVIKKRAQKGRMAGGALSFKMEALIQACVDLPISFISGQAIAAADRKEEIILPPTLKRYQDGAYMAAITASRKNLF